GVPEIRHDLVRQEVPKTVEVLQPLVDPLKAHRMIRLPSREAVLGDLAPAHRSRRPVVEPEVRSTVPEGPKAAEYTLQLVHADGAADHEGSGAPRGTLLSQSPRQLQHVLRGQPALPRCSVTSPIRRSESCGEGSARLARRPTLTLGGRAARPLIR